MRRRSSLVAKAAATKFSLSARTLMSFFLLSIVSASWFGYWIGNSSSSLSSPSSDVVRRLGVARDMQEEVEETETTLPEDEGEEEEEESVWDMADVSAIVIIVLALICLTILFEVAKEHLEESVSEDFEVILEKFFGELTVLGFLAMITFLVSETGVVQRISEHVFGEEEELVEYIEVVHFALFFVMVFFVIQVVIMIKLAEKQHHRWYDMDEKMRLEHGAEMTQADRDAIQETLKKRPWSAVLSDILCLTNQEAFWKREEVIFRALRREFLIDRHLSEPFRPAVQDKQLSDTFNFGRYLGLAQVHVLSHVVEVQLSTWGFFAFMTCVFYAAAIALNFQIELLQWLWVTLGWLVYLFNFVFAAHLMEIRNFFLPVETTDEIEADAKTRLLATPERSPQEEALPLWCFLNYQKCLHERSSLSKWVVGGVPNRQQVLFWMDRHGPHFYTELLQAELLFAGIYGALLIIQFIPYAFRNEPFDLDLLFLVLAATPLAGILCNKDLVTLIAQVSSIGTYRKEQIVRDVLLEESTTRIVRTFLIIERMRRASKAELSDADIQHLLAQQGELSFNAIEEIEVGHSFDCFDVDNSGSITKEEFRDILTRLGAAMDDEHFDRLMTVLDRDGDGEVNKEEFIKWYKFFSSKEQIPLREQAEDLFAIFDDDMSGEVTLGEFKDNLDTLNMGFTIDEIGSILNQLDRDRSGTISLEEFEEFVEKYFPRELSHGHEANGG